MILCCRPTDVMGASPNRAGLFPALSPAPALSHSPQQQMLDLAALRADKSVIGLYTVAPETTRALVTDTVNTPVGGPVGFVADLSRGNTLGPELLGDPNLDSSAYWTSKSSNITISGGKAVIADFATISSFTRPGLVEIGGLYYMEMEVESVTSGGVRFTIADVSFNAWTGLATSPGTYGVITTARVATTNFGGYAVENTVAAITRMSLKRIAGNCAIQNTATYKPILRKTPITGQYWLEAPSAASALNVTFAAAPGVCTVFRAQPGGVTEEVKTIGTSFSLAEPYKYNGPTIVFKGVVDELQRQLARRFLDAYCPALGFNKIVNGAFDINTSGWKTANGGTENAAFLSLDAGAARITNTTDVSADTRLRSSANVATDIGKVYQIKLKILAAPSTPGGLRLSINVADTAFTANVNLLSIVASGEYSATYVASSVVTSPVIRTIIAIAPNDFWVIDTISLMEIL